MPYKDPIKRKEYFREYYLKNKNKIDKYLQQKYLEKRDSLEHLEMAKINSQRYRDNNRELVAERARLDWKKSPEKVKKARHKVFIEIRAGRLIKPNKCQNCGKKKKIDAHHEDYNKPLDVLWLCRLCHKNKHRTLEV